MSIVPGRDIPRIPDSWIKAINERINEEMHEDLCRCADWPEACKQYYAGQWDESIVLHIAAGVLIPLLQEQLVSRLLQPLAAELFDY